MNWVDSPGCKSHELCLSCRNGEHFRRQLFSRGDVDVVDFACPEGAKIGQTENLPARGLGTVIEQAVKPIAKALKLPCLDAQSRLKPGSPCARRRDALNRAFPFPRQTPP